MKLKSSIIVLAALAAAGIARPAQAQQASITLGNYDAKYCYTRENSWELSKKVTGNTVVDGVGTVTWTVKAIKTVGATTFVVHGGLTVTNTGTAPATIGNIVVNLQKPNSPKKGSNASHVSIAADVADAVSGDAATSANIVAAGSQENAATNALWGTNNYSVSGAKGMFVETAGSGTLNFTDASDNTIFSLVPQPVLSVGESKTLLYEATFQTSVLPPAGVSMRVEAIVTFGNAGLRGGGGSTGKNIDVNGDGVVDSSTAVQIGELGANDGDEANVRSVPCRTTMAALPGAPEDCNAFVVVTDEGATTTGTAAVSNPLGFGAFPAVISDGASWDVSVDANAGEVGGKVCNEAKLQGETTGGTLSVIVGYDNTDPLNPIPVYAKYICCEGADLSASDCAEIGPPQGYHNGSFCTFSQGGLGNSNSYGYKQVLEPNFFAMYGLAGVTVGHAGNFHITFTSTAAVEAYLPAGGPGGPAALTANAVNPLTTSAHVFGGQVLALKLSCDLSSKGFENPGLGGALLCGLVEDALEDTTMNLTAAQAMALNGQSISQILADAENVLGGGASSAYGLSIPQLNDLVNLLNLSFDGKYTDEFGVLHNCGGMSAFAAAHLCPP